MDISQKTLKRLVSYDPTTGVFTRRQYAASNAKAGDECGCLGSGGYIFIMLLGKRYPAAKLAFLYMTGAFPKTNIDHINGIRTDNSWSNLRDVPIAENNKNKRLQKNNVSGVHGVNWCKTKQRWMAQIQVGGKKIALGSFAQKKDAVEARDRANRDFAFHENHGKSA